MATLSLSQMILAFKGFPLKHVKSGCLEVNNLKVVEEEKTMAGGDQREAPGPSDAHNLPHKRDQIAFLRCLIRTGARQNPAACGTHHGNCKRRYDTRRAAEGSRSTPPRQPANFE